MELLCQAGQESLTQMWELTGGGHGSPLCVTARRISPWTEEPGGLQPEGHKELDLAEVIQQVEM